MPVIAFVSGDREQIIGVAFDDLLAYLSIVFLRGCTVNVHNRQRVSIDEGGDFKRANAVVRSLSIVTTRSVSVESGAIYSYVSFVFIR